MDAPNFVERASQIVNRIGTMDKAAALSLVVSALTSAYYSGKLDMLDWMQKELIELREGGETENKNV